MYKDYDEYFFSGDEETYTTLDNTAASDQSVPGGTDPTGITRLTSTDHGFKAGSCVYIQGTTNYDGLRYIEAVAANTFDIRANYVAETPAGTETVKTMHSSPHPFEFLGFEVHLDAASATAENLVVSIDATKGAAWDVKVYSLDMNTIQDIVKLFDTPMKCSPDDKINVAWNNTNDKLWGVKLYVRRLA